MINADDMQSWAYLLAPTFQFINSAGKPLTEGWLEVYIAGTRNKYYCASDFNGTLHPFQIPLDSLGANIVLADPDQAYDVYVYNKYGSLIMSRYHVSPGMAGGSGVLNITIGSEDGTVSVTNDGNGNFDLSIQDTVDRIDALEQAVSGLSADSSVGYAIAHAYTVELDGTFDLVSDAVTGIGYTTNMDGFRLKSGHVYQFNFNALFENGAFDRNCSGKLYLEGPNTIAQEWKFDLDDSYYHSQSINGSTVLVTPKDLNYYDVKLKLAWDVDYPNKPNVDLNKISIVDITTLLRTNSASGTGGDYIAGDGIFINDETNVISVDMDYINSHLDFDASSIIASAVNIATAYTDARVTSVSGDLVNLIAEVSASIPTGTVTQVQSDWTEQDSSSPAYIQHKPDLTVYATNASLSAVSSVLQSEIDAISGAIPTDYVTHNEVSAVSGNIIEYVNSVSGDLVETINNVSGDIIHTVESVSGDIIETVNNVSGDIIHTVESVSGDLVEIIETATANIPEQVNSDWNAVSGKAEILNKPDLSIYATHDELVDAVTAVSSMIPTDYVTHNEVSAVSANIVNYVNSVSGDITNYVDESIVSAINVATGACEQVQSDWTEDDTNDPAYIQNKPNEIELIAGQNIGIFSDATTITISASATDISGLATHSEVNTVSGILESEIQTVSAAIGEQVPNVSIQSTSGTLVINETVSGNNKIYSIDVAPTSGIEYGQFYATNITGAATMSRTKGNIDITNDGKIKLKQGQSYHVTVRGRYNQSVLKDNYGYASYIEYVTNNSININVDESRSGSQYFELSYDLFKLNSDTDYYIFFTLDDATVNDLFIDVHSLANVGGNSSSGGSSPEYDAGYGIQILNNVISVSGIAPQVQSDWNQTNSNSVDYIKNKPEEYGLIAGDNISITASGNNFIISSTASAASGTNYQAGYGIDITGDTISVDTSIIPSTSAYATHTEVNNVSAAIIAQIPEQQVNSDWTATSGVAEILNKPNESELIAGAGVSITASGSNYIISAVVTGSPVISGYVTEAELETVSGNIVNQIPDVSNLATKTELATVSASIPNVSGFATVELVSAVSGKLPTTEVGKFTIQNNVSGGPIEVICPTDQAPDAVFYQINSVSGYAYSNVPSYGAVNYYYGETPADFNGSDDVISFTINDTISNITSIYFYYVQSETSLGGPNLSTTSIPIGSTYSLQSGTYRVKAQYNQAPGIGYGKYLQIMFNWRSHATDAAQSLQWTQDALSKITFFGVTRPDPTLGSIVNLDRYYLGNTSTITNTSSYTQAVIYTDPTSKKQSVYLPLSMPYNWTANSNFVQSFAYGSSSGRPSTSDYYTKQYRAYKYTSSPTRYQFAYCTDWDYANNIMTFVSYDDSGNAIEKWTLDYTINGSNVWTTTPISSGSTYTAGDYIGITDDTISVTGITDLVAGDNITITASGSSAIISSNGSGDVTIEELASVSGILETEIQVVSSAIPDISSLASKSEVNTVSGTLQTEIVAISGAMVEVPTGVSGVVAGQGIAITASGSDYVISCTVTGSSSSYSAGNGIDITNNVISIDNTVALKNEIPDTTDMATQTWVGNQGYLTSIPSTYVTDTELNGAVSGLATKSEVQTVSAAIPSIDNLATKTEVSIVEANVQIVSAAIPDVSNFVTGPTVSAIVDTALVDVPSGVSGLVGGTNVSITASGSNYVIDATVPDVSNLATKTDVATVSAAIPDTSTLATKTEVTNGLGTKQDTLTGITDVQVVQSLPASPVSTVLYLIPEA